MSSVLHESSQILLLAGTGGHGEQLKRLRRLLPARSTTVIAERNLSWDFPDVVHYCPRVVDYHNRKLARTIGAFMRVFLITASVVRKNRPKLMMSTGPALAVPAALACKFFGIPVIHIESWSRIKSISNTTAILRRFRLTDIVVYQYRESVLAGEAGCEYWGHL